MEKTPSPLVLALSCLSRRSYHSLELQKKLKEKGVSEEEIPPVIEKLRRDGYLDDEAFEARFVESFCRKGKGPHLLQGALYEKGLISLYSRLKEKVLQGKDGALEREIAKFRGDLTDPKEKRRLILRLQRKGFDIEEVLQVVKQGENVV